MHVDLRKTVVQPHGDGTLCRDANFVRGPCLRFVDRSGESWEVNPDLSSLGLPVNAGGFRKGMAVRSMCLSLPKD